MTQVNWTLPAQAVLIKGSFDNWTSEIPLQKVLLLTKTPHGFSAFLPPTQAAQKVVFKFIVDGEWMLSPFYPSETDETGNTNNFVLMAATSVFAKPQDPALQLVPALSMQPVDHRAEQGEQVLVDNVEPRLAKAVSAADLIMLGNTAAPKVAMNSAAAIGRAAGLGQAMSLGEAESQKALQRISSLHESSKQMEQVLAEPTSSLDLLIKSAAESFDALDVAGVDPILVSSGPGTPISAVPATPAVSDSDSQMAIVGTPVDTHVDMDSVTAAILAETASTSTFAKSLNMPESIAVQEVVQVETTIPVAETPLIAAPELAHANVDILAEEIAQLSANDSDAIVAEAIALAKVDTSVVSDMASTTAIVTPLFNPSTTDTRVFNRTSSDAHKAVGFTEPPVEIVSTPTITRGKSKFGSFFASQKTLGQDAEVVPTEPKEAHKPKMGVKGFFKRMFAKKSQSSVE